METTKKEKMTTEQRAERKQKREAKMVELRKEIGNNLLLNLPDDKKEMQISQPLEFMFWIQAEIEKQAREAMQKLLQRRSNGFGKLAYSMRKTVGKYLAKKNKKGANMYTVELIRKFWDEAMLNPIAPSHREKKIKTPNAKTTKSKK